MPDEPLAIRPCLVRPLNWHWETHDKHGRIAALWSRRHRVWSRQLMWTGIVHEGLEAGDDLPALARRVAPHLDLQGDDVNRKVRTYLFQLHEEGYVDLGFQSAPDRFLPHLETVRELGRGGVGVAWLCRDHQEARDVVVKHPWSFFQPLRYTDRLIRDEAAMMERFDHPGVVRRFGGFERDGLHHIVREYVEGTVVTESLHDSPVADQQDAAIQILEILLHLHARGHLILDLRPANFFAREGAAMSVVLVDLGSCVPHQDGSARTRKGLGTPGFTAPELRRRGRATTASMLYGYGRLLFQIAAGRRPLRGHTAHDMRRLLAGHPFTDAILALTRPAPADRPQLEEARGLLQ